MNYVVNGKLFRPFSYSAGVTAHSYSMLFQRRITDFGAEDAFGRVQAKVQEHYGFTPTNHSARTITEKHAEIIRDSEVLQNILSENGVEIIIAETDGSMVPIVTIAPKITDEDSSDSRKRRTLGWLEARLSFAHAHGAVTPIFNATLEKGPDNTGDQLLDCVIRAGGGENSKIHGVGDGASWIASQFDRILPGQATYLIDFMHLCEYLEPASKVCSPKDSLAWLKQQKVLMKEGNISDVIQALEPHIEQNTSKDEDSPVRSCYRYITNRLDQFDYKTAIELNLPTGSGEIESGHRYIIQKRLKLAGAWWLKKNAHNMLALRVLRANGGWDKYWDEEFKKAA